MAYFNKKSLAGLAIIVLALFTAYNFSSIFQFGDSSASIQVADNQPEVLEQPANYLYDILVDDLDIQEAEIGKNEFLSDILARFGVPYQTTDQLAKKAKDIFDVRKLRSGKKYTVLSTKDSLQSAQYFIYDPSPYFYVVFDMRDTVNVYKIERPIDVKTKTISGVIISSLWNAFADHNLPWELAVEMEDIYGWSVDFHHLLEGDQFKLVYEEESIEGEPVGVGAITSSLFTHRGNENYAFYYAIDDSGFGDHYYDEKARPMKKAFLKAPLKYTRISSSYNLNRYHPVLRRVRPHLGTDYAAPHGTPIYAVANGTIIKASYSRGNGNYVKIKHDNIYTTQYLHMSGFAKSTKVGAHVKQGEVIGYVGSTGLATGPHVCFRFWKNGRQVDHRREKLPPPEPMPEKYVIKFNILKDSLQGLLDAIPSLSKEEIAKRRAMSDSTYVVQNILP